MPPKKIEKVESLDAPNLQVLLAKAASKNLELEKNIKQLNIDYEEKLNEKDKIIKELKKEIELVKKSKVANIGLDELEDKQKVILGLRAKLWQKDKILNYAMENALDGVTKELIDSTIDNMDTLKPSLIDFYNTESEIYKEKLKTNGEEIKKRIEIGLIENIDIINLKIKNILSEENQDDMMLKTWIEKKNDAYKTLNSLLGNIVEEDKETAVVNVQLQEMQRDIKERNDKIQRFGIGNVKVVS